MKTLMNLIALFSFFSFALAEGTAESCTTIDEPPKHDFELLSSIYEEQGWVLLRVSTPEEAKMAIEKITKTDQVFSYNEFGLINQRKAVAADVDKKKGTENYSDAPHVPTLFHNECAYNLKLPAHFCFWMNQPATTGGATQILDSLKQTSDIKEKMPEFWEELRNTGLEYCVFHPDDQDKCGKEIADAWKNPGINTYSKSFQELLGVTELDGIPSHENPNIHYAKRECGIEKCTHVRGVINSTFGETTINQFSLWSPQNFYNYGLERRMHPYNLKLRNREITDEEWKVLHDLSKPHFKHRLSSEEMMIVNNLRFAHGRTPFTGVRRATIFLYGMLDNTPSN